MRSLIEVHSCVRGPCHPRYVSRDDCLLFYGFTEPAYREQPYVVPTHPDCRHQVAELHTLARRVEEEMWSQGGTLDQATERVRAVRGGERGIRRPKGVG